MLLEVPSVLVLAHVAEALPAPPPPTHLLMLDSPAGLCKHRLEMPVQCPALISLAPWHRDAPQDGSCHSSRPWTRAVSLFSFCSSLHTPVHAGKSLSLENVADSQVQSSPSGALCSWGWGETEEGISQILQESDYLNKAVVHRVMYKSTSPSLKGFASQEPGSVKKWERIKSPEGTNQQRMLSCKVSS